MWLIMILYKLWFRIHAEILCTRGGTQDPKTNAPTLFQPSRPAWVCWIVQGPGEEDALRADRALDMMLSEVKPRTRRELELHQLKERERDLLSLPGDGSNVRAPSLANAGPR